MADFAARLAGQLELDDDMPSALVYDLAHLESRAMELQANFPGFHHCVALKAAPYVGLIQRFGAWGFGFEAASFPEGLVAHRACPEATILYDSPAKSRTEIARAEAMGWILSANSFDELARISSPCSLRINTRTGSGNIAHTSVANVRSRFGEPFDELPPELNCAGWHAHIGSQGCSVEQLVRSARRLVDVALRHPGTKWLNIGGGMPARGHYADYAYALRQSVPELFTGQWTVYTEMGRSLLAACAKAYSKVEYVRRQVATIHLGADYLLRRVYRPEDWIYPMRVLGPDYQPLKGKAQVNTIAGPLCFAGDVLGTVKCPPMSEGDIVEISLAGAYTTSMWSRHCSRRMPPVFGLAKTGDLQIISLGESDDDVVNLWRAGSNEGKKTGQLNVGVEFSVLTAK